MKFVFIILGEIGDYPSPGKLNASFNFFIFFLCIGELFYYYFRTIKKWDGR